MERTTKALPHVVEVLRLSEGRYRLEIATLGRARETAGGCG